MQQLLRTSIAALLVTCATGSHAQGPQPATGGPSTSASASGTALASFGKHQVTVADFDAWVTGTIPERDRVGWAMNQNNINKVINDLLQKRTVADEAKKRGLDKDPVLKLRVEQYTEKLQTELILQRIEEEANREFEQKRTSFTERAREQYLINKERYQRAKEIKASHILVGARGRSSDEALAKAKALRERAVAGEPFDKLAEANSDDPSARSNKGDLGFFATGQMDPAFETAAFALTKPMEISQPVKTPFGWHIIRLDDVRPAKQLTFDEALPDLLENLRAQYVSTRQQTLLSSYYDPSKVKWNEPAVVGLKKIVDPAVFKVPEQRK